MSNFEVIEKAINEHGKSVEEMKSGMAARMDDLEQKLARRGGEGYTRKAASPVRAFIESNQLNAMREGANTTGRVELKSGDLKTLTKAITSAGVDVQPQRAQGLYDNPQQPLTLIELLPVQPVSVGQYEYVAVTTAANGAAYQVAEGDLKGESNPTFETRQANIAQIAHWTSASVQVLSDAAGLETQLNNLMRYGAQVKLEDEIINGTGGAGEITGLMQYAMPYTETTGLTPADRIGKAITALSAAHWRATAIIMHPMDWFDISASKSADEDYIMGSPRNPAPPSLWGIPVVTSASMPQGTVLVMDTNQVALLDREQPIVMASREDGDNFRRNLVTILAELRAGLAVYATSAVLSVALTDAV